MKEGVTFEITNYNAKGKDQGKSIHTINKVEKSGGNIMVDVSMEIMTEQESEEPIVFDYQAMCEDGKFVMNRFSGMSMEQMGSGVVTVDGDYLDIPSNVSAGQSLPDARMTMHIGESGSAGLININYDITNRKVEGFETVETPAGSYEAMKISYDMSMKMVVNIQSKAAEWFVEGVGVVKSEQYNKKGKLQSYSLLTAIDGI